MIPIKTQLEIAKMRVAGQVASSILRQLSEFIQPGVTTKAVDDLAVRLMRENDARSAFLGYRGFPGNICISINEQVVHGIGGSRRIQYGDIVKLDVGIIKNGWVGDNAMTVAVGVVDPETERLLKVTRQSLYNGIAQAREGNRLKDVCAAIEKTVLENGMTVVREFVGHGVGRKLHEEPQVPNYVTNGHSPRLRAGMVLAIEPMVNQGSATVQILKDNWTVITSDNKLSSHFEHSVLITSRGPAEILTPGWDKSLNGAVSVE